MQKSSVMVSCDGLFFSLPQWQNLHFSCSNNAGQRHTRTKQSHCTAASDRFANGRQIAGKFVIYHMLSPAAKLT
jgi:hypothetical protein